MLRIILTLKKLIAAVSNQALNLRRKFSEKLVEQIVLQ